MYFPGNYLHIPSSNYCYSTINFIEINENNSIPEKTHDYQYYAILENSANLSIEYGKSVLNPYLIKSASDYNIYINQTDADGNNNIVYTYNNEKENKDVYMVALRDENGELIGYYEKHEYRTKETGKLYEI